MRRDASRLLNPVRGSGGSSILRGMVLEAPGVTGGPLRVVVKRYAFDQEYEVPADNWVLRSDFTLPVAGDPALILFDDFGDAFVIAYGHITGETIAFASEAFAFFNA